VYKVAWLVKLAGPEDRAERSRRWGEEHGALMRAVPGLERHAVNRGLSIAEGPGAGREAPTVDGVACAWFSDRAAFESALRSPEWKRVLDHGRGIFDQAWEHAGQAVEIEERIMRNGPGTPWSGAGVPPGMCKHIGVLEFRRDLTRDAGRAWWTDVHGPIALRIPRSAMARAGCADGVPVLPALRSEGRQRARARRPSIQRVASQRGRSTSQGFGASSTSRWPSVGAWGDDTGGKPPRDCRIRMTSAPLLVAQ